MLQKTLSAAILCFMMVLGSGCATQFSTPASAIKPVEAEFNVAPKQMVETVRQTVTSPPISIPVESADKGVIITGYQPFPGEWHILRRWQEQTRYRISVIPDWEQPTAKCRLQITEETQTRATNGQTWDTAGELNRQDRSQALLQQISQAVKK